MGRRPDDGVARASAAGSGTRAAYHRPMMRCFGGVAEITRTTQAGGYADGAPSGPDRQTNPQTFRYR